MMQADLFIIAAKAGAPRLVVKVVTFDPLAGARALLVSPDEFCEIYRDSRAFSPIAERLATKVLGFERHTNSNQPITDGSRDLGGLGAARVSVKCCSRHGVNFLCSAFKGKGRKATDTSGWESLVGTDRVVVVDHADFPMVRFLALDTPRLLKLIDSGEIGKSGGWSRRVFVNWLIATFNLVIEPAEPARLTG